jgi:ADP-ribosylglycohydrolase
MTPESKYRGAMLLSAIGDALGWMTEFVESTAQLNKRMGVDHVDRFHAWSKGVGGRFNGFIDDLQPGAYSDDTQLLLAVARSIDGDGRVDQVYFSKTELAGWLGYARGGGRTVKQAAAKIQRRSARWNDNFFRYKAGKQQLSYVSAGANGVAMRILPIALANHQNWDVARREILRNGLSTHGHPRAHVGAVLFALCIERILVYRPEDFEGMAFLASLGQELEAAVSWDFGADSDVGEWMRRWSSETDGPYEAAYAEVVQEGKEGLRLVWRMLSDNVTDDQALDALGCKSPESRSSGMTTVLGAIYLALKNASQPVEAVTSAVNCLATDSDSIAAFVGAMMGALHGHFVIPDRWKAVQDAGYIERVALDLAAIAFGESSAPDFRVGGPRPSRDGNVIAIEAGLEAGSLQEKDEVFHTALGHGTVLSVDHRQPLVRDKVNFIVDVQFESGQSCRFSKLLKKTAQLDLGLG